MQIKIDDRRVILYIAIYIFYSRIQYTNDTESSIIRIQSLKIKMQSYEKVRSEGEFNLGSQKYEMNMNNEHPYSMAGSVCNSDFCRIR